MVSANRARDRRNLAIESDQPLVAVEPAKNHYGITSLIVRDHGSGDILSTRVSGGTRFYKSIEGEKWGITVSELARKKNESFAAQVSSSKEKRDDKRGNSIA